MVEKAKAIVMSDEMVSYIAEQTYRYYTEQNTDTSYTDALRTELKQVESATANLIRAMEAGIFNDATRTRMAELDEQRKDLEAALAAAASVHEPSGMGHHVGASLNRLLRLIFLL